MGNKIINFISCAAIIMGAIIIVGLIVLKNQKPATNENKITNTELTDVTDKKPSGWVKYLNDEYGFVVSYPDSFAAKKVIEAADSAKFSCGEQLGKSVRVANNDNFDSPVYEFAVYSNPASLFEKDFFICQTKAGDLDFDENKIKSIRVFNIGEQKISATEFILYDSSDIVLVRRDNRIYEFKLDKNENIEEISADFEQILSTVVFFEDSTIDRIESFNKLNEFCAIEAKNEYGNGIFVFALPLVFGNNSEKDFFAGCAQKINNEQTEWRLSKNILMYHLSNDGNGNYQILWKGYTGSNIEKNNFGWTRRNGQFPAGDIDNNGFNEIILTGNTGNELADCSKLCNKWCLYAPKTKETKCLSNCSGWTQSDQLAKDTALMDCPIVKTKPVDPKNACASDTYFTQCFDGNEMKNPENAAFRNYLEKEASKNIWLEK